MRIIAGNTNSNLLAGDTAAAFGRTALDQSILYVVTNGGIAAPVNGTYIEGREGGSDQYSRFGIKRCNIKLNDPRRRLTLYIIN